MLRVVGVFLLMLGLAQLGWGAWILFAIISVGAKILAGAGWLRVVVMLANIVFGTAFIAVGYILVRR